MAVVEYYPPRCASQPCRASTCMTDEGRSIPLEELDEETRREVIKTRRVIRLVGLVSIGILVMMIVFMIIAVLLVYAD